METFLARLFHRLHSFLLGLALAGLSALRFSRFGCSRVRAGHSRGDSREHQKREHRGELDDRFRFHVRQSTRQSRRSGPCLRHSERCPVIRSADVRALTLPKAIGPAAKSSPKGRLRRRARRTRHFVPRELQDRSAEPEVEGHRVQPGDRPGNPVEVATDAVIQPRRCEDIRIDAEARIQIVGES